MINLDKEKDFDIISHIYLFHVLNVYEFSAMIRLYKQLCYIDTH